MSRVVVINDVTLDGVMQGPGRPDEDTRDGFERGGWALPHHDDVMGRAIAERMARADAVAELRREPGADLGVLGSGELIRSLMRRGLIDAYLLLIHPLLLGTGRRLFPDAGARADLRLVDSRSTTTGGLIATYQPA